MEWLRLVCGKSILMNNEPLKLSETESVNSLKELEYKSYYINPFIFFGLKGDDI